jgi:hypothetical protein
MAVIQRHYRSAAANPGFLGAGFDRPTLLFTTGLLIAVALLVALPSAVHVARTDIHAALKESARTQSGSRRMRHLRELLLAVQVALATLLLLAADTTGAAILRATADKGFDPSNVVHMRVAFEGRDVPTAQVDFRRRVLARLSALPGVEAAALAWPEPFAGGFEKLDLVKFRVPGQANESDFFRTYAARLLVSGSLLGTLRIPLHSGRLWSSDLEAKGGHELLVDQVFVETMLGGKNALGQTITLDGDAQPYTIVGVVQPIKQTPFQGRFPWATIYLPHPQDTETEEMTFLVRTQRPAGAVAAEMRQIAAAVEPRYRVVDTGRYPLLVIERMTGMLGPTFLTSAFGLLALALAALGLHSAAVALVVSRTNELAVRLAVGASPARVLLLVLREGVRPILVGVLLCVLVLAVGFQVEAFRQHLFNEEPFAWRFAPAAALLVSLCTLLALLAPARRASELSPYRALRSE